MTGAAIIEYLDGRTTLVTADTAAEVASLRAFAATASTPGRSRVWSVVVDGVRRTFEVDHADLAGVRLVTS